MSEFIKQLGLVGQAAGGVFYWENLLIVGGAVLTSEVAASIGADAYAPDPMAAVRYADEVLGDK